MSAHPRLTPGSVDDRFHVGPFREGIGRRSVRSGFARFAEQGGILVLSIGSTAALARLLTPEDFGLIAMVSVLTAVVKSVKHFGLPMALVHQEEIRPEAADALFWMTAGASALVCLGMAAAGPGLAFLFGEPRLVGLTTATAGGLFLLALGAPQEALLMRQMRFGALSSIAVGSEAVGMAVGVGAAWGGMGVWALIVQFITTSAVLTGLYAVASGWWPSWRPKSWRSSGLRSIVGYGAPYAGFGVVEHLGRRMDRVLVGVMGGAGALGLYDSAFRWSRLPVQQVFTPLLGVAVAGLSRVRDDPERFRGYVRRSVLPVLAVTLPALAFVVVAADPVVRVLLGSQWLEAIPLLRWLAAATFLRCFSKVAQWLFLAEGRTMIQFRWALLSMPVLIGSVAVGVQWGAYGVAVGFFVATAVLTVPEVFVAVHRSAVTAGDLWGAAWRPVVGATVAAGAVYGLRGWLPGSAVPALGASMVLYTAAYAGVWFGLPGGVGAVRDVLSLLGALRPTAATPPSA